MQGSVGEAGARALGGVVAVYFLLAAWVFPCLLMAPWP